MQSLNKLQLAFEGCVRRIRGQPGVLAHAELLVPHLRRLEEYVNKLVHEWQDVGKAIAPGCDASLVADLQALQRFLAPAWTPDGFKENASAPVALLVSEIEALRPTSSKRVAAPKPSDARPARSRPNAG